MQLNSFVGHAHAFISIHQWYYLDWSIEYATENDCTFEWWLKCQVIKCLCTSIGIRWESSLCMRFTYEWKCMYKYIKLYYILHVCCKIENQISKEEKQNETKS